MLWNLLIKVLSIYHRMHQKSLVLMVDEIEWKKVRNIYFKNAFKKVTAHDKWISESVRPCYGSCYELSYVSENENSVWKFYDSTSSQWFRTFGRLLGWRCTESHCRKMTFMWFPFFKMEIEFSRIQSLVDVCTLCNSSGFFKIFLLLEEHFSLVLHEGLKTEFDTVCLKHSTEHNTAAYL